MHAARSNRRGEKACGAPDAPETREKNWKRNNDDKIFISNYDNNNNNSKRKIYRNDRNFDLIVERRGMKKESGKRIKGSKNDLEKFFLSSEKEG